MNSKSKGHKSKRYLAYVALEPSRYLILETIISSPEKLYARQIADKIGMHSRLARFHLKELTDVGLLEKSYGPCEPDNKLATFYKARDITVEIMEKAKKAFG